MLSEIEKSMTDELLPRTRQMNASGEHSIHSNWVANRSIVAYGVRVGIRTNKPEVLDRLIGMIPDIWKPSSSPAVERLFSLWVGTNRLRGNGRLSHQLYEDQQMMASSGNLEWVIETLETQLKMYLAEMARRRVFVHAGAVGWQGKAIIIPGRSFSGKTSLVAELVRAGATYYSDEYAVLDKHGRVHPYASPLAVREPDTYKQTRCRAEDLGGENGTGSLPVGLVIVTHYKPRSYWRPRSLSVGQAVLELLANTIPARRKPKTVITTLHKAITEAIILKSARGEAKETAELILDYLH